MAIAITPALFGASGPSDIGSGTHFSNPVLLQHCTLLRHELVHWPPSFVVGLDRKMSTTAVFGDGGNVRTMVELLLRLSHSDGAAQGDSRRSHSTNGRNDWEDPEPSRRQQEMSQKSVELVLSDNLN
ncbi:hypothetical protein E1B28_013675 [Marasmius oreades]|uniref:Uncharacterized protein n=1 Tax=Marasmius oreades TaxID=181124 RepID=A0A9P7RQ94_9AGAR|nr:uncharacterized protein E1B28_013675 [Marasmius oreades]KAG7087729.1 hypothetical protein E1B28_013675 [Marasmius oreades]